MLPFGVGVETRKPKVTGADVHPQKTKGFSGSPYLPLPETGLRC